MDETELLKRVRALSQQYGGLPSKLHGPGDDCALLEVAAGKVLAVSTDMYQSGIHFPASLDAESVAGHCLTGAISDLAAVGAEPLALTIAASSDNPDWLSALLPACFAISNSYQMRLIGGDISQGPASLCITVFGQTDAGQALSRSGAGPGDDIWVSGWPGEAAAGLAILELAAEADDQAAEEDQAIADNQATMSADERHLVRRFCQPTARISLGMALHGYASTAIDVSDGLLTDLDKLLDESGQGGVIDLKLLPVSTELAGFYSARGDYSAIGDASTSAIGAVCGGGDDYELCFTAPESSRQHITGLTDKLGLELSRIGKVTKEPGLRAANDAPLPKARGWRHFNQD